MSNEQIKELVHEARDEAGIIEDSIILFLSSMVGDDFLAKFDKLNEILDDMAAEDNSGPKSDIRSTMGTTEGRKIIILAELLGILSMHSFLNLAENAVNEDGDDHSVKEFLEKLPEAASNQASMPGLSTIRGICGVSDRMLMEAWNKGWFTKSHTIPHKACVTMINMPEDEE